MYGGLGERYSFGLADTSHYLGLKSISFSEANIDAAVRRLADRIPEGIVRANERMTDDLTLGMRWHFGALHVETWKKRVWQTYHARSFRRHQKVTLEQESEWSGRRDVEQFGRLLFTRPAGGDSGGAV